MVKSSQSPPHCVSLKWLSRGAVNAVDQGSAVGIGRDERWAGLHLREQRKSSSTDILQHTDVFLVGRALSKHKCVL